MGVQIILNRHYFPKQPAGLNKHGPASGIKQKNLFYKWWKNAGKTNKPIPRVPDLTPELMADAIAFVRQEERTMIGQELHDNVNQILMSAKLFLEMLHPGKKEKSIRDKSLRYIAMAIEEIRKVSRELIGEGTGQFDLAGNINRIIADIHLTTPVKVALEYNKKTDNLSCQKKLTLFRIIQEQLRNIITHSKASEVMIKTDIYRGNAVLEIRDDGIGFDAGKKTMGIGLSNIYERARSLNGTVALKTSKGCGCVISILLPAA